MNNTLIADEGLHFSNISLTLKVTLKSSIEIWANRNFIVIRNTVLRKIV